MDKNQWGLNKSQRMQIKAFICLLGFLLIVVLLVGKLVLALVHGGRGQEAEDGPQEEEPHIPVVQELVNVWIAGVDQEGLSVFWDGEMLRYPWGAEDGRGQPLYQIYSAAREQVADVVLTDGCVTSVQAKTNKINGKILSADDTSVEVEGYGRLPLAADYKGYRLYGSLENCTVKDLFFGYDFTDLCLEDGEVCALLMVKEEAMEYIRVLVKASDYDGNFHEQPLITCDVDYTVVYGSYDNPVRESHPAGEELTFVPGGAYFQGGRVRIVPDVLTGKVIIKNCLRSQGTPAYRGSLELLETDDGIIVVNEVLLEEYLYSVVPSEMPSKYPSEALKAQAICARTYAYGHMQHAGLPKYGAHVDDSTSYQVYNNILEQESTTAAVKETYGQLLFTESGNLAGTYYYSTSCGVGSDANVWKTEAASALTYLRAKPLSRTAMEEELDRRTQSAAAGGGGHGAQEGTDGLQQGGLPKTATDMGEALKDEDTFRAFITSVNKDDFEWEEGWYRWTYDVEELDSDHMLEMLQKRYDANGKLVLTLEDGEYVSREIEMLDDIREISIVKRGAGGVADELVIETASQNIKVISEHNIRYILSAEDTKVIRQDGSRVASTLLPSGFFVITTGKENGNVVRYTLVGGGFGHGVGMSQNGARKMALEHYSAGEILLYFYENCSIGNIYE